MYTKQDFRVLLVDDNEQIHDDYRKIFKDSQNKTDPNNVLAKFEAALFDSRESSTSENVLYLMDAAYQGKEAVELVQESTKKRKPYALAFVDVRMPPGMDGIETIGKMWEIDPDIQIVIISAYSEYSWDEIVKKLGKTDNFYILKKPFEIIELRQLALALTTKWALKRELDLQIENLQTMVEERTLHIKSALSLTNAVLDSISDGILVLNNDNKIVKYNKSFLKQWGLKEKQMHMSAREIFKLLSHQIEEPSQFINLITNLSKSLEQGTNEEWQLVGRNETLELQLFPQILNNEKIGTVLCFRDVTIRKGYEQRLIQQSNSDSITDLPNRVLLFDKLNFAITQAENGNSDIGVFLIGLEDFSTINVEHGYNIGDTVLKSVANKLIENKHDVDFIARFEGAKFVVTLSTSTHSDFALLAKKILNIFLLPFKYETNDVMALAEKESSCEIKLTASIGISVFPKDGRDVDTLLKNAEKALLQAREQGKNTFAFYQI